MARHCVFGEGREVLKEAIQSISKPESGPGAHLHKHKKCGLVPCQIVVVMEDRNQVKEYEEDYAATCALIQNFQLAAWEVGLGAPFIRANEFKEKIGVKANEKVVALLNVGYPETVPQTAGRQSIEHKLTIIDSMSK